MRKELAFLKIAEGLKIELRHSWLSNRRQESVAEHSWRLALMVMRYADKLDQPIDIQKGLQYAIIHDLPEAIVGDIPIFECQTIASKEKKLQLEHHAMQQIKTLLNDPAGEQLYALWIEYEEQQTYESKIVKALDKLEAFIQHNEAPIETWEEHEKLMIFHPKWLEQYCLFDSFIHSLYDTVVQQTKDKLEAAGENIEQLQLKAQQVDNVAA